MLTMGDGGWNAKGLSPFLSERALSRAPQVLSYAAVTGAAVPVSPRGEVVLFSGSTEVDIERIARLAAALGGTSAVVSFAEGTTCVHAAPVCMGWMLCILSTVGVYPGQVVERLHRASAVLALALVDGVAPGSGGGRSGPDGAPAEVFAARLPARKN
jgi:hypothetical protein